MNAYVNGIKQKYIKGNRLRLLSMADPQPVPSGTEGTVESVDDMGQIHMKWDNGSTLALIVGEDEFQLIEVDMEADLPDEPNRELVNKLLIDLNFSSVIDYMPLERSFVYDTL